MIETKSAWCGGALSLLLALGVSGCVPPTEPETPVEEPEPVEEGAIPWAPGEAPEDAASTTREVGPEPRENDAPHAYYEDDGVIENESGPRCTGKAPPALRAEVDVRASQTRACYDDVPQDQAEASGDLKISVRVSKKGAVESVEVLSDSLEVAPVTKCVEKIFRKSFSETPPRGGCTVFVVPLHFEGTVEETEAGEAEAGPE